MTLKLEDWTPEAAAIDFVDTDSWPQMRAAAGGDVAALADVAGFEGKTGGVLIVPGGSGVAPRVFFGVETPASKTRDPFLAGKLAASLPKGLYRLCAGVSDPGQSALAFLLSCYSFTRYGSTKGEKPRLCAPEGADRARIERIAGAVAFGRDLVNTPANDMGPEALAEAATALAARHGATCRTIVGDALLSENFPLIHAVGRAAAQAPRLDRKSVV